MYGQTLIFVENFHVNNLSAALEIFMCLILWDKGTHKNYLTSNISQFMVYAKTY